MKNRSLLTKQLLQLSGLISVMIVTLVVTGFIFSTTLNNMADSFKKDSYQSIDLVLNADRDIYQAYNAFNTALQQAPSSEEYKKQIDDFNSNVRDVANRMSSIQKIVDGNTDMQNLRNESTNTSVKQDMDEFFPKFKQWEEDSRQVLQNYEKTGAITDVKPQVAKNNELFSNGRDKMNAIGETLALYPDVLANNHISSGNTKLIITYISVAIVLALVVLMYIFGIKRLTKSLGKVAYKQEQLATALRQASIQLSAAGQQLSEGSNEQAASIEETSASMEETLSMVKQNVENTRQTRDLSEEASESSMKGSSKMSGMKTSMEELKRSSNEISKIIKVIDEIAFQTNILALNAAVEAARAGEAGLGFAVVAEEVRNLAHRSAQAAKDTAVIIERNIELSDKGVQICDDVDIALKEISTNTNNVNQLVGEIAAASEEQSKGIGQVTEAIAQMEKVVQQNAAVAQESAASAQELQSQAEELENVVTELNVLVMGSSALKSYDDNKGLTYKRTTDSRSYPTKHVQTEKFRPADKYIKAFPKQSISPNDVIPLDDKDDF